MKKIIALILCLMMCMAALAACGENSDGGDAENGSSKYPPDLKMATMMIQSKFDFEDTSFIFAEDEYSEDTLINLYGIEDEAVLEAIENFAITYPATNSSKTYAVLLFKEGTDAETIEAAEQMMKDVYIASLITTNAIYDPAQSELAEKATFKVYDNALVLAIYDTEGNTEILDAVK